MGRPIEDGHFWVLFLRLKKKEHSHIQKVCSQIAERIA